MALTDENNSFVMPVSPMYGGGGNGFGFGDGNGFWILLLFLLLGNNGWGNGFGGGFDGLYPWMNNSQNINGGFRDQMLNENISNIRDGVYGINNQLCSGFGTVNQNIANGFAQAEISNNARQIADMNQAFASQTAMLQGFNGIQSQLAQCCCDQKSATNDLKYVVATENCADRTQAMQNTRDIIDSQTRSTQAILDKLCQLELDGVKGQLAQAQRENVGLQNQLNMANFNASQAEQNALFAQGLNNEVDALYNRLKNCPVGTTPVYGNQPIFTCGGNTGCGCGCGGSF